MELGKHADVTYENGDIVLKVHLASLAKPALEALRAQVESGAIDPIKGTDLDKAGLLKLIDTLLVLL